MSKEDKVSLDDVMRSTNEICGAHTLFEGVELKIDPPRLPTGVFAIDFACMAGEAEIQDARTGLVYNIKEMVLDKMPLKVISHKLKGELDYDSSRGRHPSDYGPSSASNWVCKGLRECVKVETKFGVSTIVALDHCFLTGERGWVLARNIEFGDYLIRPAQYRWSFGDARLDSGYLDFLGYWIAEGSGAGDGSPRIAATLSDIVQDLERIAISKEYRIGKDGIEHSFVGAQEVRDWRGRFVETNIFRGMLKELGLWGKRSYEKIIPSCIFELRRNCVVRFFSRLFMGDGSVSSNRRALSYTTTSYQLAHQVRFLLMRLGIYAYIIKVPPVKNKKFPNGRRHDCREVYHVYITGLANLKKFYNEIPIFGYKKERLAKWVESPPPIEKRRFRKWKYMNDSFLDPVVRIERVGKQYVFDLSVEPHHNFVADDVINHNTGGGLPIWASTCLWGPDAGGKTSLGKNVLAMVELICWRCFRPVFMCTCSKSPLLMRSCWLDIEGTFDRDWATSIGSSPEKYLMGVADYGEQFINIGESVLRADDCGLLVADSLGALTPMAEMEAPMEDQFIGLQARMITRMVRKLKQRLLRERKRGHPCVVLFVNQLRIKIGQLYGDPETMPGGKGLQHEFSLLLRCVKKALKKEGTDKKYFDAKRKKNMAQRHSFAIRKEKVLTIAGVGEYVRVKEPMPEYGLTSGAIDDYNTLLTYAKEYGVISGSAGKWKYFEHKAKKLDDIRRVWLKKPDEKMRTQLEVIKRAKARLRGKEDVP